jgi:DnaJ-class molecular chaperone
MSVNLEELPDREWKVNTPDRKNVCLDCDGEGVQEFKQPMHGEYPYQPDDFLGTCPTCRGTGVQPRRDPS